MSPRLEPMFDDEFHLLTEKEPKGTKFMKTEWLKYLCVKELLYNRNTRKVQFLWVRKTVILY